MKDGFIKNLLGALRDYLNPKFSAIVSKLENDTYGLNSLSNKLAKLGTVGDKPSSGTIIGQIGTDGDEKTLHDKFGTFATGKTAATELASISQELGKLAIRQYTIADNVPSVQLDPKAVYVFAERTEDLALTYKAAEVGQAAEYHLFIQSSGTPTIDWGDGVTSWNGGSAPTIASGKTYEVSIMNGIGAFFEV